MRKSDLISGLFLLAVSAGICITSLQLEVGKPNAPGSGFFPLLTGLVLGLFAMIIIIQSRTQKGEWVRFWLPGANKRAILIAFFIILVYALLLERLGFLITTIFFFVMVSRFVSGHAWKTVAVFSLLASLTTYVVFKYLLRAPLPPGVLEGIF